MNSIYIINPKSIPYYYDSTCISAAGKRPIALFAELSIVTVAAFAPPTLHVRLCDEEVAPADLNPAETHIFITGKTNQFRRMTELATHYRSLGKKIVMGGPYASLAPEECRPYCDTLFKGELEEIAGEFFSDLASGNLKTDYEGPKSDLRKSPIPRWDLYPLNRVQAGALQISRGCPFSCEFCDVIQYAGQKQRMKSVPQVLAELDTLYKMGMRDCFITDDNLTASRNAIKEILEAIIWWNKSKGASRMTFFTQMSIDAANDPELLKMCANAGLVRAFVGIESTNLSSLKSVKKNHNTYGNMVEKARAFVRSGMIITAGTIFGFDEDGPSVFSDYAKFVTEAWIPFFPAASLIAYRSTPLYARLKTEDRLLEGRGDAMFLPWQTNMTYRHFSRKTYLEHFKAFIAEVYSPEAFEARAKKAIDMFASENPDVLNSGYFWNLRPVELEMASAVFEIMGRLGERELALYEQLTASVKHGEIKSLLVWQLLVNFIQIRFLYGNLFSNPGVYQNGVPIID